MADNMDPTANEGEPETNASTARPEYPEPLVVEPLHKHKQSFIILHGRGSNAESFGGGLMTMPIEPFDPSKPEDFRTLATAFPHAKFILPTAAKRRAIAWQRMLVHEWFDLLTIKEPELREELQIEGLQETSAFVHGLLKKEIEQVGAENVVFGGLSQGCAAMLVSLLLWEGEAPVAAFGMCGWLPFAKRMLDANFLSEHDEAGQDDPFDRTNEDATKIELQTKHSTSPAGVAWLREMLEMPAGQTGATTNARKTPIYLGHGVKDEKVPIELGRIANDCLSKLGANVTSLQEHPKLAHWYSPKMLREVEDFIKGRTNWTVEKPESKKKAISKCKST